MGIERWGDNISIQRKTTTLAILDNSLCFSPALMCVRQMHASRRNKMFMHTTSTHLHAHAFNLHSNTCAHECFMRRVCNFTYQDSAHWGAAHWGTASSLNIMLVGSYYHAFSKAVKYHTNDIQMSIHAVHCQLTAATVLLRHPNICTNQIQPKYYTNLSNLT